MIDWYFTAATAGAMSLCMLAAWTGCRLDTHWNARSPRDRSA